MISACGKAGQVEQAFQAERQMRDKGLQPDLITHHTLILACQRDGHLDLGLRQRRPGKTRLRRLRADQAATRPHPRPVHLPGAHRGLWQGGRRGPGFPRLRADLAGAGVEAGTTEIKDCLQNGGVPAAQFKETCSSLSQATAAMGGPAARVTWLAACPPQPQGSCEGFFGQPMTSFYYKRDPKTLANSRSSCQAQGGKWK